VTGIHPATLPQQFQTIRNHGVERTWNWRPGKLDDWPRLMLPPPSSVLHADGVDWTIYHELQRCRFVYVYAMHASARDLMTYKWSTWLSDRPAGLRSFERRAWCVRRSLVRPALSPFRPSPVFEKTCTEVIRRVFTVCIPKRRNVYKRNRMDVQLCMGVYDYELILSELSA